MSDDPATPARAPAAPDRVIRHRLADRLFHWINAAVVLTLLGTSLLPVIGIQFAWVTIHWIAGILLIVLILYHAIRAFFFQTRANMGVGLDDARRIVDGVKWGLHQSSTPPRLGGKYPFLQKFFHYLAALMVLTQIATGVLMLLKIDTPFWQRNPYILPAETWGVIYVLHGLAALTLLGMVIVHIYFGLRPDKMWMTRSMIRGWITRAEFEAHHDPALWAGEGEASE